MMPRELYRNTAGKIEARDTANRRKLTAEERRKTPPDLGDADTVFADRGNVNYMRAEKAAYDEETASIKEQIIRNQETLNKMAVVSKKTVPTNLRSKPKAAEWAINELNTRPEYVDRRGLGKVDVSQKAIREAVKYADTPAEKAALVAAPDVIKRGIEVGGHNDHKSRRKATLTIAAPVELNGQRGNMAVVINLRGNKYYAHRILTPDGSVFEFEQSMEMKKDTERESQRGVTVSGSLANATSSVFINTIRSSERESQGKTSGRASTQVESREYAELRREYERRAKAWNEANDRNDESFPFASELRWITDAEKRLKEMKEAGETRKRRGSRGSRRILRQRVLRSVKNKIDEHTQQRAAKRGERSGERRPRPASGLLLYGEQRCGARPVYQRKDDDARRRFFCPAVREQYPVHCRGRERPV